jgi:hypothetical protein
LGLFGIGDAREEPMQLDRCGELPSLLQKRVTQPILSWLPPFPEQPPGAAVGLMAIIRTWQMSATGFCQQSTAEALENPRSWAKFRISSFP